MYSCALVSTPQSWSIYEIYVEMNMFFYGIGVNPKFIFLAMILFSSMPFVVRTLIHICTDHIFLLVPGVCSYLLPKHIFAAKLSL